MILVFCIFHLPQSLSLNPLGSLIRSTPQTLSSFFSYGSSGSYSYHDLGADLQFLSIQRYLSIWL